MSQKIVFEGKYKNVKEPKIPTSYNDYVEYKPAEPFFSEWRNTLSAIA